MKSNAFADLGSVLGGGFDPSLSSDAADVVIAVDQIFCSAQERSEFEDDDNTLIELGQSLQTFQVQAILVRPVDGGPCPYELVAGERRLRAARLVGLPTLRAHVKPMSDQEAADARFAENIQRKNLSQVEEARRLQADVDELGVPATLRKHHKSAAWLSKRLKLINLPTQSQRLVTEAISADVELINDVRQIELVSPDKAKTLVDVLKATRGQQRARGRVQAVKRSVKSTTSKVRENASNERSAAAEQDPTVTLNVIFDEISTACGDADAVLQARPDELRRKIEQILQDHHDSGRTAEDASSLVLRALMGGEFGTSGAQAYCLAAFVQGVARKPFSLHAVLNCATPALLGSVGGVS